MTKNKSSKRDALKRYLSERGATLSALARALGREPGTLYRALAGKQKLEVPPWAIFEAAETLDCDPRMLSQLIKAVWEENQ